MFICVEDLGSSEVILEFNDRGNMEAPDNKVFVEFASLQFQSSSNRMCINHKNEHSWRQ